MPFVFSPAGAGYVILKKSNKQRMAEYCEEASTALAVWMERYEAAANHAGVNLKPLTAIIAQLDAVVNAVNEKPAAIVSKHKRNGRAVGNQAVM